MNAAASLVQVPVGPVIELRSLAAIIAERRAPRWLPGLRNILECDVLAILAGSRGTFKSFIANELAMRTALEDQPVVLLSGEGAGLGMRAEAWIKAHAPRLNPEDLPVTVLERPLQLSVPSELDALATEIDALPEDPALIVVDTWSKFAGGLDENSNSEVAGYLSSLSRGLRERFGSTVLIVAHTGHNEGGRPRGASALAANTDAEYIVTRAPGAMQVSVSRERFKDTPSLPPLGYEARVIELGREDEYGDPVTSLALYATDAPVLQAGAKAAGNNQRAVMAAVREWARTHDQPAIHSDELRSIHRTAGIARQRVAELNNFLVNAGILTPSVGGFMVNRGAL